MNNSNSTFETAERLLSATGIATTPVTDCEDSRCPWCQLEQLPLAA